MVSSAVKATWRIVDPGGTSVAGLSSWQRTVVVEWVDAATCATPQASETGAKRITVTVSRGARPLASGAVIRTRAWSEAAP